MNLVEQEWLCIKRAMLDTLRTGKVGSPKFSAELVEDNQRVLVRNQRGVVVKSLKFSEWAALK